MSFLTSLSGLKGAQSELAVISNNVANVGSIGFKKSRAEFSDIISASPQQSGNVAGLGTRLKSISQQFTQGGFQTSDRALDLAMSGQGYFVTKAGAQMTFTRNGAFSIDDKRYLVDGNGAYVQVLPVDTVGAGDAFVAGYLAELLADLPVADRLATAVRTGAFACLGPGDWESYARRSELPLLDASDPVAR